LFKTKLFNEMSEMFLPETKFSKLIVVSTTHEKNHAKFLQGGPADQMFAVHVSNDAIMF